MRALESEELMDLGQSIAEDLLRIAYDQQISPKDLVMEVTIAQRLLQSILYPDQTKEAFMAQQESDATYDAAIHTLEGN